MTTERYPLTSKREQADRIWGMVLPLCDCGRPLGHPVTARSSRCGAQVHQHAA